MHSLALGAGRGCQLAVSSRKPYEMGGPSSYRRDTLIVSIAGIVSARADTLFRLPSTEWYIFHDAATGMTGPGYVHPFTFEAEVTTWADRLVVGTREKYELYVVDTIGRLHTIVRRADADPIPLRGAVVDRYLDSVRARSGSRSADEWERQLSWYPDGKTIPTWASLIADDEGYLWVGDFVPRGLSRDRRWDVLDPDGRIVAHALTPDGFQPLAIGSDRVVGRVRDEMNIEYIQVHDLQRGAETSR